jgi:hypothetical protein
LNEIRSKTNKQKNGLPETPFRLPQHEKSNTKPATITSQQRGCTAFKEDAQNANMRKTNTHPVQGDQLSHSLIQISRRHIWMFASLTENLPHFIPNSFGDGIQILCVQAGRKRV